MTTPLERSSATAQTAFADYMHEHSPRLGAEYFANCGEALAAPWVSPVHVNALAKRLARQQRLGRNARERADREPVA